MPVSALAGHEEQEARSIRIGALEPFDLLHERSPDRQPQQPRLRGTLGRRQACQAQAPGQVAPSDERQPTVEGGVAPTRDRLASLDPEPGPLEELDPAGAVEDDRMVVPAADPGLDAARQLAPAEPAG